MVKKENKKIWTVFSQDEKKLLQKKLAKFDFSKYALEDIEHLIAHMEEMMIAHKGVGLSANQIGLDMQVFIARLPHPKGKGYVGELYAIFNPKIISRSLKKIKEEEGCLSIPKIYGSTKRSEQITLKGQDKYGKPIIIKAQGFLARIFQHEVDHLNGRLFVEKAKELFQLDSDS